MTASNQDNVDDRIEKEVQRRLASRIRPLHEEIVDLRKLVQTCQNDLIRQHNDLTRLTSEPLSFGTLLKVHNCVDPSCFKVGDEVMVTDQESPYRFKGGEIVSIDKAESLGQVVVRLTNGTEAVFSIGVEGKSPAQIRLTKKKDGTFAVVNVDGKPWEVKGIPDFGLQVGDVVKIKPDTKAIVCKGYELMSGPVCQVIALLDNCIEVMHKGDKYLVFNPRKIELNEGDRIVCDSDMYCVLRKLPQDARHKYKVSVDIDLTWNDIGGLDGAKQELMDVIELPYRYPDLCNHYGIKGAKGILLYGPAGCGKTLLARVAACVLAKMHGKDAAETGYIYVKGPEILDKWVGNSEAEIRNLFGLARNHYRKCGYKAILVIDEADAIMPQRGMRISSSISDTIVPMFLGEMSGIDEKQLEENPIVMLLTNRQDVLDPAIIRHGRINSHIKVDRPNEFTSIDILKIHTRNMPFQNESQKMPTIAIAAADLFSKSRVLYRINNEHDFTLGDCVNGAMLASLSEMSKLAAIHRDISDNTKTGVCADDFRQSVQKIFRQQHGKNHSYDVVDFCEKHSIHHETASIERRFGSA